MSTELGTWFSSIHPASSAESLQCSTIISVFFRTTIITLVANSTTLEFVSARGVLATSIPVDDDQVTCIPLPKLGQGRTSLSTFCNLMNLAALAGTTMPQHATLTRESLIYRENPRLAVGFSCLQLFSTECRRCGRKVWVVFIPFCFAM
ncbi:hypothetical protein QQF64_033590 [Cirrhinus molitorella]|uniref:Uncharacterized protein n=1 Tax=Cirrhinus molitorella TaxID=172907 RepID=A0ABR3MUC6_9TELE